MPLNFILANRHVGHSAKYPIYGQGVEDIFHLLFQCPTASDLWGAIGMMQTIDEVVDIDREGSAILEHILRLDLNQIEGFQLVNLKEVVMTTCWYLWWLRRQRTHNEPVHPLNKCNFFNPSLVGKPL
jgi:hypothetical protein